MGFGALILEFILGLLVEAGMEIEQDPQKRERAMLIAGGILLVLSVGCLLSCALVAGSFFLFVLGSPS
ncbi:MAG: hypothetical protein GVY30_09560 [Chloroflexi bacterium]|jgi:hypothetical protein|nr:hypothetical protein [Chloroflexota bacterium]